MADVRRALADLLERQKTTIPTGAHFVAAVSGGADSLALAWAAEFVLPRAGYSLEVAIVDHGLQEGSTEVATEAATRVADMGLEATVLTVEVGSEGGVEHAARTARYEALRRFAAQRGPHGVLLGHTMDDQAETVLLGLSRGSGPSSISGMAEVTGLWWRPFLRIRRDTTRQALVDAGVSWWDDPHNTDDRFLRPRVRHRVLDVMERELGPGIVEALAHTADLIRTDDAYLDSLATAALEPYATQLSEDHLPLSALDGQPEPVQSRMLRQAISTVSGEGLWLVHTEAVMALVTDWHGQGPIDVPGARVERSNDMLHITRHQSTK